MTDPLADRVLSMEAVRFHYPGTTQDVLNLPTLQLKPNERLLVRGDSGCGKSTLLSLAAGVLSPSQGSVRLLGQDWGTLKTSARDAWRVNHVGYIFQQFNLLPYLSVLDNVLMPCRFSQLRAVRARQQLGNEQAAAEALLSALELSPDLWRRSAGTLSVGQQQRVAAARALIGQPELVIADEPTSALDESRRDMFMQLLIAQCELSGCALLFVSHDSRLASHFSQVLDLQTINRAAKVNP